MKKIILSIFIFGLFFTSAFAMDKVMPAEKGKVIELEYVDNENIEGNKVKQSVTIKILTGQYKNSEVTLDNMLTSNPSYDIILSKGDNVILHFEPKSEYIEDIDDFNIYIADIERVNVLYLLTAIFFAILFIIGRKKGILSFLSICATITLIFFALTPMILNGINPIVAALIVCIISTIITIYLVGGFNYKSISAILGTILSLILSAILSIITIKMAALTGFSGEEPMYLYATRPDLDFTGILSASMMLAALGAVMDVGVSIASTINEIYLTDNTLSIKDLFSSGMNVGKDIIGTMSNTLILVYLGSALPLVLLSNNIDFVKFFNLNQVTTEISSALIGSIAILTCVPITAIISAYTIKKYNKNEQL